MITGTHCIRGGSHGSLGLEDNALAFGTIVTEFGTHGEHHHPLRNTSKCEVKEVLKRIEPTFNSIPMSCDIPELDPYRLNTSSNIMVLLAMSHSQMQQALPSEDWFGSLKVSLETASILKSDKWITGK
ncbi:unnamed protein product [Trichobilharzia regenti]|nr:unnamed protein product [Trichobilharzia regenti]